VNTQTFKFLTQLSDLVAQFRYRFALI